MKIRIHEIQDIGSLDAQGEIQSKDLSLAKKTDPSLISPVSLQVHAEVVNKEVQAFVQLQAVVTMDCSRCLESFDFSIQTSFSMQASLKDMYLDVTDDVRQALFLALPAKPLCQVSCRGLCAQCGINKNKKTCKCHTNPVETPFAALKEFKLN